jgi:hypothetical protein
MIDHAAEDGEPERLIVVSKPTRNCLKTVLRERDLDGACARQDRGSKVGQGRRRGGRSPKPAWTEIRRRLEHRSAVVL